ncbi:MAG: T9SS type A sorting domain-containing protein [Chitinophagales bacterium]
MNKFILINLFFISFLSELYSKNINNVPLSFSIESVKIFKNSIKEHELSLSYTEDKAQNFIDRINKQGVNFSGFAIPVNIDLLKKAKKYDIEDGYLYIYKFKANAALNLQLFYKHFFINEGAYLYIYTEDRKQIIGPLTHKDNSPNLRRMGPVFHNKKIIIEYFEPKKSINKSKIIIDVVKYGVKKQQKHVHKTKNEGLNCLVWDWIVSPVFVPQSNTEFRFSFGISSSPERNLGGDDVLEVMVSTDCLNFETLYAYDSTYVHPPMMDPISINDLSAYEGQEIMVAIRANSNGAVDKSVYLGLDDIYIGPALETNISESSFEEEDFLRVFPNPSEGLFELKLPSEQIQTQQGDWKIRVRNMQGALVYEDEKRQLTSGENEFRYLLDLRERVRGVYLVEVWNGEKRWIQKIVKK